MILGLAPVLDFESQEWRGVVNVKLLPAISPLKLQRIKSKSKILFSYFAMKRIETLPPFFIEEPRVSGDRDEEYH